jgi:hypothetical protein
MKSRTTCRNYSYPTMVLFLFFIISGCKKNPGAETVKSGGVYVSGVTMQPTDTIATIWGNGASAALTNNTPNSIYSVGEGAAVSGSDIYVAGYYEIANGDEVAMVWENGIGTPLGPLGSVSAANAIAIQGGVVYVAGVVLSDGLYHATYWNNGQAITLPDQGGYGSSATAIAVQGSNVYVAGWSNTQNSEVAVYWMNGTEYVLSDSNAVYSTATGIAVNGNDLYVLGWEQKSGVSTATYWLNGAPQYLSDSTINTRASSITLGGNDVYISGTGLVIKGSPLSFIDSSYLMYWKNNILQDPTDSLNKSANMTVGAIAVSGDNIYIAGTFNNYATLWKNDALTQLTNAKSIGLGLAIAP